MTTIDFNSPKTWQTIIADLGPGLLNYFCAVTPRHVASDLVQEVFLRLVVKIRDGQFDFTKGSPRMFAYGIARFVRLEALKSKSATVISIQDLDLGATPKSTDDAQALRWAVGK